MDDKSVAHPRSARDLLESSFGPGLEQARQLIATHDGARRIYECALGVIDRLIAAEHQNDRVAEKAEAAAIFAPDQI